MTNPLVESERARQNARGDEVQLRRARDAAEALFKPRSDSPAEEAGAVARATPAAAQPSPRRPRIIAVPPAAAARQETPVASFEAPAKSPPPAAHAQRPRTRKISEADHGRIRILATHGLTLEQVAELYGVPTRTIERIVGVG